MLEEIVVKENDLKEGVLPINKIIHGDTQRVLKKLPSNSIDCIVTSPPYWGLRDYEVEGQIGMEPTLEEYFEKLLGITAELKRVLKPTGVMFWVHGDSWSGSGKGAGSNPNKVKESYVPKSRPKLIEKLPPKCLTLQGIRLAIRMIDEQGWILRNDIIWYKPNHMPESVKDRFTKSYEHVFMFVKKEKYWFDLDAVREPHKNLPTFKVVGQKGSPVQQSQGGISPQHPLGKNPGDVWVINTEPFPEAHFAVFPTKLVERCILAGCPPEICKRCGEPRKRIIEVVSKVSKGGGASKKYREFVSPTSVLTNKTTNLYYTIGWTDCGCGAGFEPGIVLDPFLGSGTTALVALKLGRRFVGVELNEKYCKMACERVRPYLLQQTLMSFM